MSVVVVLYNLLELPVSENMNAVIEITNQVLNDYRIIYNPISTIDNDVEDMMHFAEKIDLLPLLADVNNAFPGMKEYVNQHLLQGIGYWDDWNYCSWVAIGMLRFIGREIVPPAQSLGFIVGDSGYLNEPMG